MRKGIDISKWQGNIDFNKTASDGVEFVILREGYRKTADPKFYDYVSGAQAAGISIDGVYHFSYATSAEDAVAEAQACIEHVKAAGLGDDVIIFYDFEYDTVDDAIEKSVALGKAECISFTQAFCDYVRECGYRAGVYANMDYYRRMYTPEVLGKYILWLADHTGEPDVPCVYHQYSASGKVSGIAGNVDMDYCYAEEKGKMAVIIGSARSNENGSINGGKAGDQTGGEVSTQEWYLHSKGWVVLRPKSHAAAEVIAATMQAMCDNPNFGYCQDHRLTGYNAAKRSNFNISAVNYPVEIDCSEAVRVCLASAGIDVADFSTATEASVIMATGKFDKLTDAKYCMKPDNLVTGDILVTKSKGHTVVVVSGAASYTESPGWHEDSNGWQYIRDDGTRCSDGWALINHYWYLFAENGYMLTGWQQVNGEWFYLDTVKGDTEGQCWHEKPGGKGALEVWYVE